MEEELENQGKNKVDYIRPYMWKKGQSGNILGRPKGKTMKEYARQYLERMTDEERDEWLEGLSKDTIWEMAEGKPDTKSDVTSNGQTINVIVPTAVAEAFNINATNTEAGTGNQG